MPRSKKTKTSPLYRVGRCTETSHIERDIRPLNPPCKHCGGVTISGEATNICCGGPSVAPALKSHVHRSPPKELVDVINSDPKRHVKNALTYNRSLQLASCVVNRVSVGRGLQTIKLQGSVYHLVNSIEPTKTSKFDDGGGSFLQVYFSTPDTDQELQYRLKRTGAPSSDAAVIQELTGILKANHALLKVYQFARSYNQKHSQAPVAMVINETRALPTDAHVRQFSSPSVNEVAAVVSNVDGPTIERHSLVVKHNGERQHVSVFNQSLDAMAHPLLNPVSNLAGARGRNEVGVEEEESNKTPVSGLRRRSMEMVAEERQQELPCAG